MTVSKTVGGGSNPSGYAISICMEIVSIAKLHDWFNDRWRTKTYETWQDSRGVQVVKSQEQSIQVYDAQAQLVSAAEKGKNIDAQA